MAASAIRTWWNKHQLNQIATSVSNTEEEKELAGRKMLTINLNQTLRTRQLLIDFEAGPPVVSLRAPLDLVNLQSVSQPRWPKECEVVSDAIHHIEWDPPEPEPFYQPTGDERTPIPAREERGKVVYCIDHAKRPYFTCSRAGGSRESIKSTHSFNQTGFTLEFESRFESGNLQKAVQVGVYEYELTLRTDLYTKKHTQWFYFRVRNMEARATYRFTIINLMKSSSLYSQGMRPLLYSERAAEKEGVGWRRTGANIRYYRSCNQNAMHSSVAPALYSLTWTLRFPYDADTCYLAHCYPYTYSDLQRYLRCISSNPAVASYCALRVLCRSLAGNAVYVVTVTSRANGKNKKAVVVTARVHPGETNGSWMMEGFLDFLLGDSEDAQLLRDTFIFKVVPMLNPDGVIVGNHRCSLAGRDLNRNYNTLLRDSFPCVWHTRNMVERLVTETDVLLYCDFHGHSRKNNVFMYGCAPRGDASLRLKERVFPLMMSKNANNKFSFRNCKFRVQKSKEGTGRVTMWRLGVKNSYTMEATFGGSTLGDRKGTHFTTRDLKSIGFYFCDTLLDYCDPDPTKTTYCLRELAALMRKQVRERLGKDPGADCNISLSDLETSTGGSNSSDSDGLPVHLLQQPQTGHLEQTAGRKKQKRLRSYKERNRLRPQGLKKNAQPLALHSNFKNISLQESSRPPENTAKESIQERQRRKWQINGLIREAVIPPSTNNPGELSQVTPWRRCEPPKVGPVENLHHRAKACPRLSQHTAETQHTDGRVMDAGRWRCSSQLLQLSTLLPSSPYFLHPTHQRPRCPQHAYTSLKSHRGLPPSPTAPHRPPSSVHVRMFPTKRFLSTVTADEFSGRHILSDRDFLRVSEHRVAPEDSLNSQTDATTTKQKETEQEEDSAVGLTLLRGGPFGELNQRVLPRESGSRSSLFGPALRGTVLRGNLLCKETSAEEGCTGVLLPVSKSAAVVTVKPPCRPWSDTRAGLQDKDSKRYPAGQNQRGAASQENHSLSRCRSVSRSVLFPLALDHQTNG